MRKKTKVFTTQTLAVVGLLMAMDVIMTRFFGIQTPITRVTFGFLPSAIIGALYGPWVAGIAGMLTDLLGIFLFNRGGTFFIGFTLSAFLGSAIYGLFLHRKNIELKHVIGAVVSITIFVNLILNTAWIVIMYEEAWRAIIPLRVAQNLFVAPIRVLLIYTVLKQPALQRLYKRYSTAKK